MKTRVIAAGAVLLGMCALQGCSSGTPVDQEVYDTTWVVFVPNEHHVVIAETSSGSKSSDHLLVVDLGDNLVPKDIPRSLRNVDLSDGGKVVRLIPSDGGPFLEFSTTTVIEGMLDEGVMRYPVVGIAELTDEDGWVLDLNEDPAKNAIMQVQVGQRRASALLVHR